MDKKKALIRVGKILVGYFIIMGILGTIFMIIYHKITYDPYNELAMPYIWETTEISEPYGKVTCIIRHVDDTVEESEHIVYVPYIVETEKYQLNVCVTFFREGEKLTMEKMEITEVNDITEEDTNEN